MKAFLAAVLMAFCLFGTSAKSFATCPAETRLHLRMANTFYKDYQVYNDEHSDSSATLAQAQLDNFMHQMHWLNRFGQDDQCDRSDRLLYVLLNARKDAIDLMNAEQSETIAQISQITTDKIQKAIDSGQRSDLDYHPEKSSLLHVLVSTYYMDVSELYSAGYARINPAEYSFLKQDVRKWYMKVHKRFKSWEKP